MDHQWFWETDGDVYGPLSTDELEDLHPPRSGSGWRPGPRGRFQRLVAGSRSPRNVSVAAGGAPQTSTGESAAQSAARLLAGASRQQLLHEAEPPTLGARLAALIGNAAKGPAGLLMLTFDLVGSGTKVLCHNKASNLILIVIMIRKRLYSSIHHESECALC